MLYVSRKDREDRILQHARYHLFIVIAPRRMLEGPSKFDGGLVLGGVGGH